MLLVRQQDGHRACKMPCFYDAKGSSLEAFEGPALTLSNFWKNRPNLVVVSNRLISSSALVSDLGNTFSLG